MRRVKILIAEDIPAHNKGEAALFLGMIESLKSLPNKEIGLLSTNPLSDAKEYSEWASIIDARGVIPEHIVSGQGRTLAKLLNYSIFILKHMFFLIGYFFLRGRIFSLFTSTVWREYVNSDIIIMGHDSFWTPIYHTTLLLMFKALNKTTAIYAGSLNPANLDSSGVKKRLSEFISLLGINAASSVTLREEISLSKVKKIGVKNVARIGVYPDLAFLVSPVDDATIDEIFHREGLKLDGDYVGMAFNRRTLRHASAGNNTDESVEHACKSIAEIADKVVADYDAEIVFVPHSIGPTPNLDDRILADKIIGYMVNKKSAVNIVNEYSPMEIKGIASRLFFAFGSRLHFCIDAISMAVPTLFLTYEKDIRGHGIIQKMLKKEDYVFDIDNLESTQLLGAVFDLMSRKEEITAHLKNILPELRKATYCHGEQLARIYKNHIDD